MRRKYSIGFLIFTITIVCLLVIVYRLSYHRAILELEEELLEKSVDLDECYYIKDTDGYVTVYMADEKTVYDTAELVQTARPQFESCGTCIILSFIKECIKKSVTGLLWRDRELSPAYINKLLYEKLNAMTPLEKENAQKLALNITNANKNRFHDSSARMKYDELEELLLTNSLI